MKKTILISTVILISIVSNLFAVVETNDIKRTSAPNGSLLLEYKLFDTVASEFFAGPTTIIDKKGVKIVDLVRIEGLSNYHSVYFDGKLLLIETKDGLLAGQIKVISFKVGKKGLKKLNEIVFDDAKYAHAFGELIVVTLSPGGATDIIVYNNKLSKKLFEIPSSDADVHKTYPNGVVSQSIDIGGNKEVTYTKKGKPLSQHSIPIPAEGDLKYRYDDKGGLLYWIETGSGGNYTNSPITYVNKKGKKILDNAVLDGIPVYWYEYGWNTKYLYLKVPVQSKILVYKIGKNTVKVNESDAAPVNDLTLEKSKVYVVSKEPGGDMKVTEYDKNMEKEKWDSPYYNNVDYVSKGVFQGTDRQTSGTGKDITVTIFKGTKNIAVHNYYEP